jgi:hypothetical protein
LKFRSRNMDLVRRQEAGNKNPFKGALLLADL